MTKNIIKSTTIIGIRKDKSVVIAGDGQASLGNTVMKANVKKVRRLGLDNSVIAGFAGSTADAFACRRARQVLLFLEQIYTTHGSIFNGANLVTDTVFCRNEGSNHQTVHPLNSLTCEMLLNGNVYYVNQPNELKVDIIDNSSGRAIFDSSRK